MKAGFLSETDDNIRGYTLTELLIALSITALVSFLSVSLLIFFNRINSETYNDVYYFEQEYQHIMAYLQKQIEHSEYIYVKDGRIYLQDLESGERYYNYFTADRNTKILYRIKTDRTTLKSIGSGSTGQFSSPVEEFIFTAEKDKNEDFTGLLHIQIRFRDQEKEEKYETIMAYPGGKNHIIQK